MGTRYSHLSLTERHQIARLRDAKVPVAEIARRLDRHVATVHRELRRNRTDAGAWLRGYFAVAAQTISDFRRRRLAKLMKPTSCLLRAYIGQHNVTTMVERTTLFVFLIRNPSRHSAGVIDGVASRIEPLTAPLRRTVTFDRGTEFAFYPSLKRRLGVESYFCKPQAPWQKGTVENANGRIRRFLPGETDLAGVSQLDLDQLAMKLNMLPRKCLSYRTPYEVFAERFGADRA